MSEKNTNPFIRIQGDLKDVPSELRKKVMNDVAMAKLILEMATVFTTDYASLIAGLMKTTTKNK